jgi:polar amino acid transport system substrate-binding protein
MNRRSVLLGAATVFGVLASGAVRSQPAEGTLARVNRTKVLRVGAVAGAIPYFKKDPETGKWEGFVPDFAESLARKLGVKVEYVETTWGNAVLDIQSKKIDAMFGMAPSPARMEAVNFSQPLFENTYTLVCRKGFPNKSWAQLNAPGSRIAVDVGSSHDQVVTRMLPNGEVSRFENSGAATLALQAGRADCQVLVILLAQPLLVKRPDLGVIQIPAPVQTAPVCIAMFKEDDASFQQAVNAWLAEIRAKGEVRSVILKNMDHLAGVRPESFPPEVTF